MQRLLKLLAIVRPDPKPEPASQIEPVTYWGTTVQPECRTCTFFNVDFPDGAICCFLHPRGFTEPNQCPDRLESDE